MKAIKIFFLFVALCAAGSSFAQSNVLKPQPLKLSSAPIHFSLKNTIQPTSLFSPETHAPILVDPVVHFPAFFCRMELKSVSRMGIWIKVHAGDYDKYSRPAFEN